MYKPIHTLTYLKARKMISQGYLYHLVEVKDLSSKTPTLETVPVVNELVIEFQKIYSEFLPKGKSTLELISFQIPSLFLLLPSEWL